MSAVKDPKIKLFGRTIELPETVEAAEICGSAAKENSSNLKPTCSSNYSVLEDGNFNGDAEDQDSHQSQSCCKQDNTKDENQHHHRSSSDELKDSNAPPPLLLDSSKEDPSESSNSQDKTLKKPDRILPCPRCNSTDTKFCYFNNYNVNQPRHFCKNCQRYWTAGGAMRNVPVGAGRRKNKNALASQLNPKNGTLLAFSSDTPPCESMVSVLDIADKAIGSKENNGNDWSSESTVSSSKDEVPVFRGPLWPYRWQNSVQRSSPMTLPTYSPASFPMPLYSTTPLYWAGPNIWNGPFAIQPTPAPSSGPDSPTLGKHSRDKNILEIDNSEKCLWVPKTMRIDDQGEDAKRVLHGRC